MHNHIRGTGYPFDEQLPIGGMKQGQQFGRAISVIFMGLLERMTLEIPTRARIGFGLGRPDLILAPHAQAEQVRNEVGLFNQCF